MSTRRPYLRSFLVGAMCTLLQTSRYYDAYFIVEPRVVPGGADVDVAVVGLCPRSVERRLVSLVEHGRRVQTQSTHVTHHAHTLKHPDLYKNVVFILTTMALLWIVLK